MPKIEIIQGDCLDVLPTLDAESVHCVVTSPPYWGLRDYNVNGQLGLESTPDEFVEKMVQVFREVRRVLRKDGTLWLNLGDSYNAHPGQRKTTDKIGDKQNTNAGSNTVGSRHCDGLKPKDLCGIPWRLALALQQPYYTGSIRDERDRIWLAAMIDGEGCMFIHKRKAGRDNGQGYKAKKDSYGAGLEVSNTNPHIPHRCLELTGKGSICQQESGKFGRKQTLYRWNVRSNECRDILRELYPHFVAKQHEARLAIGCPVDGKDAIAAHESLKAIHQGDDPTIDFPAPPSMFEPGWYLRSDIIWAKNNPMPESVTDRCTKAHEYLFLLTKAPRYYYDAEAVREGDGGKPAGNRDGFAGYNTTRVNQSPMSGGLAIHHWEPGTGRNRRSVWTIPTKPYPKAHFATFPPALVEPCILAGTSAEGCCPECGAPWERAKETTAPGFRPTCECLGGYPEVLTPVPCTVLDPFAGSGTVLEVARKNGCDAVGIELSPEYCKLIENRLQQGMLF